jgi:hypothetical protein
MMAMLSDCSLSTVHRSLGGPEAFHDEQGEPSVKLEDAVIALVRAIAFDRAYQLAESTCHGCGLPAVRQFGHHRRDLFMACGACRPPREHTEKTADHIVETLDELSRLDLIDEMIAAKPSDPFSTALVRSLDKVFSLEPCGDAQPNGVTSHASFDVGHLWYAVYEVCDDGPFDLLHRKAVERLLRVANGEER